MKPKDELPKESIDKLLEIIVSGDPEIILSEANKEGFKDLMKYELITLVNGKVSLTELGIEAQRSGVCTVIEKLKLKPAGPIPPPIKINNNRNFVISGLVFLSLLLFLLWGYLITA